MKSFFKELFEYNHHINQKLAEVFLANAEKTNEKSVKLFNHILNAHQIWNSRIELIPQNVGVWDIRPTEDFKQIDKKNYENSIRILDQFGIEQNINYSNTKGEKFNNSIKDMLFHVINHSNYHRAQINTELKQSGMEPLVTDYIFYKR